MEALAQQMEAYEFVNGRFEIRQHTQLPTRDRELAEQEATSERNRVRREAPVLETG